MTKEEFGVTLYACIKLISALHTIRQQLNFAVHKHQPKRQAELITRYQHVRQELAGLLPTLNEDEMRQVLAKYPDVASI